MLNHLAACHGFRVTAGDEHIGFVETPVFAAATVRPDYLLVRTVPPVAGAFRVVPTAVVGAIDATERRIHLDVAPAVVSGFPERLPLLRD
jgi:hypothetical protein